MASQTYSLDEFWNIVAALANDLRRCASALEGAVKEEDMKAALFARRMCARAVFAAIEGATYHMTYIAYVARNSPDVVFSLDELAILEKAYDFDSDDEMEAGLTQAQMLERIKFAFNAFARVHYSDYVLPTSDPAWPQVKNIFFIREKLAHPQAIAALSISDNSLTDLLEGTAWIMKCLVGLLESSQQCVEERATFLKEDKDEPIM